MLHDLFEWLQTVPGATDGDPSTSWSMQLQSSLNIWSLLEGTHVLTLMLFAGSILFVDLRMLGVAFRNVSFRMVSDKILPMTIVGFAILIATGLLLFFANPVQYYHSVWFRAKMIFLVIAGANIVWFHLQLKRHADAWAALPGSPPVMKLAAGVSLASWALVIIFGRLIGYSLAECDTMQPGSFGYGFAECAVLAESLEMPPEDPPPEADPAEAEPTEAPPAEAMPAEHPTPEAPQ